MAHFQMLRPLYMERTKPDDEWHNFKVVAGGYGNSDEIRCRRGFKLVLKGEPTHDICWHVVDPDVAWAAAVAEQLAGET